MDVREAIRNLTAFIQANKDQPGAKLAAESAAKVSRTIEEIRDAVEDERQGHGYSPRGGG